MPLPPAPQYESLGEYNSKMGLANARTQDMLTNSMYNQQRMQQAQQMMPLDMQLKQQQVNQGAAKAPYEAELAKLPIDKERRQREAAGNLFEINRRKTAILQQQADIKQQIASLMADPNSPQNKTRALGFLVQYEKLDEQLRQHDESERLARFNAGLIDSPYGQQRQPSSAMDILRQYATGQGQQPSQQPVQPQAPQMTGPQGQMVTTDEQGRRVVIPQNEQATASAAFDAGNSGAQVMMTPPAAPQQQPISSPAPKQDQLTAPRESVAVPPDLMKLPVAARMKAFNARMDEVPAQNARINGAAAALDQVADTAKLILSHPSLPAATGLTGTVTTKIPGFGPYNVAQIIDSLEAKLAFASLGDLRQQSKTGGALGQVSDAEEQMLKKAIASVKLAQSESDVRRALDDVVNYSAAAKDRLIKAYKQTYASEPDLTEYHTVTARKGSEAGSAPKGVDQSIWSVMTPQERALWAK